MTIVASSLLSAVLLGWSTLLALHPTDGSPPLAAVLAALAGLAAAGAHRNLPAPVLAAGGLALLARPFVRPVRYFHLGTWHDLELTSGPHHGMLTRGGLLLALAAVVSYVVLSGESGLHHRLRPVVFAIAAWAVLPVFGEGRPQHGDGLVWYGDRWIAAWTAVAAVATVVVVVAVLVDAVRAHRRERDRARASASLFGLP